MYCIHNKCYSPLHNLTRLTAMGDYFNMYIYYVYSTGSSHDTSATTIQYVKKCYKKLLIQHVLACRHILEHVASYTSIILQISLYSWDFHQIFKCLRESYINTAYCIATVYSVHRPLKRGVHYSVV